MVMTTMTRLFVVTNNATQSFTILIDWYLSYFPRCIIQDIQDGGFVSSLSRCLSTTKYFQHFCKWMYWFHTLEKNKHISVTNCVQEMFKSFSDQIKKKKVKMIIKLTPFLNPNHYQILIVFTQLMLKNKRLSIS